MFTLTTYNRDGETIGREPFDSPEKVTRRLLENSHHLLANLGKRYEVTDATGNSWDSQEWLWSRPEAELLH